MAARAGWEYILHGLTESDESQGLERLDGLDGIPLQDMSAPHVRRPSPAHLNVNSDVGSSAERGLKINADAVPPVVDRGREIEEAINSGSYECGICYDENITRRDQIWYCCTCWAVYHHDCIYRSALATAREEDLEDHSNLEWSCPTCRAVYGGEPLDFCWCKKIQGRFVGNTTLPPNSCGAFCFAERQCGHPCSKVCHAGPCEEACIHGCPPNKRPVVPSKPTLPSPIRNARVPLPSPPSNASVPPRVAPIRRSSSEVRRRSGRPTPIVRRNWEQQERVPYKLPVMSLIFSVIIACWVFGLTKVVVEPFNNKRVAENNHAVRALWFFAIVGGFACMIVNSSSVESWLTTLAAVHERIDEYAKEIRRNTTRFMLQILAELVCLLNHIWYCLLGLLSPLVVIGWMFGPFISPIAVPITARSLEFHNVCKGFDTMITLDIGKGLRTYPIIKDLGPQSHSAKRPSRVNPYTVAIVSSLWKPTGTPSTLELNFYDPSYREVFGIPEVNASQYVNRNTTYIEDGSEYQRTRTHFKGMKEPNPDQIWERMTGTQYGPTTYQKVFGGAWYESAPYTLDEEPGFYRVIYDWEATSWTTQIGQKVHENGTFLIGEHLIFPSLGLQVPNFADFERSCKYEPYLKVHRGSGDFTELQSQAKEKYKYDGGDIVLRTASFGPTQGRLEMCARRRDVVDERGEVVLQGLGDKLPVVAGLIASYRHEEWSLGKRKGCRGPRNES